MTADERRALTTQIQARCTPEEREAIRRRADALGLSLSRYVVLVALGRVPVPDVD